MAAAMRSWCCARPTSTGRLEGISSLGVTAGASAPEVLVEEILDAFAEKFELDIETVTTATEDVSFPLPRQLREEVA